MSPFEQPHRAIPSASTHITAHGLNAARLAARRLGDPDASLASPSRAQLISQTITATSAWPQHRCGARHKADVFNGLAVHRARLPLLQWWVRRED
jgi:hypothetical protein